MNEELTGKNKEQFLNWMLSKRPRIQAKYGISLKDVPFEMKIGVYLAYYDSSQNIYIEVWDSSIFIPNKINPWGIRVTNNYSNVGFKSRNEAYKEAFKKADEIVNQS